MWPRGANCSFLQGLSDYFQDIRRNEGSQVLDEDDRSNIDIICESLNRLISNTYSKQNIHGTKPKTPKFSTQKPWRSSSEHKTTDQGSNDDEMDDIYSVDSKVKKFFDWSQTYIAYNTSNANINWQQLVELFNFQHPQFAIPSDVDVTTHHSQYLCKYCKEKGNELMKDKKIKGAIEMYLKAIELCEKESKQNQEQYHKDDPHMNDNDNHSSGENTEGFHKSSTSNAAELAIIYCNLSAAYVYLQEYEKAVEAAVRALKNDPLLTKAWIRKGMAEQELKRFDIAYGDYQVALNQSKQTDNYYAFLVKKIGQCFEQIVAIHAAKKQQQQKPEMNGDINANKAKDVENDENSKDNEDDDE